MKIRNFEEQDLPELIRIHKSGYENEFSLDEFKQDFKCFYTITDDNDKVVVVGGIRMIPEIVIMTDKTAPVKLKAKGVRLIDQVFKFVCAQAGVKQLHAFIQEESWLKVLLRKGFKPTKGISVVTDF